MLHVTPSKSRHSCNTLVTTYVRATILEPPLSWWANQIISVVQRVKLTGEQIILSNCAVRMGAESSRETYEDRARSRNVRVPIARVTRRAQSPSLMGSKDQGPRIQGGQLVCSLEGEDWERPCYTCPSNRSRIVLIMQCDLKDAQSFIFHTFMTVTRQESLTLCEGCWENFY